MVAMLEAEPLNEMDVAGLISGANSHPRSFSEICICGRCVSPARVLPAPKFRQYAYRSPENYLTDEFRPVLRPAGYLVAP